MNWAVILAVAAGGAVGAPLRHLIDGRVTAGVADSHLRRYPWGLLTVNVTGSILIGIAFVFLDGPWRELLATGACGALTTYSSYAYFVHRAWKDDRLAAWLAIVTMPIACIGVCSLTITLMRALVG